MAQEVVRIPATMAWKDHITPGKKNDNLIFTCDFPVTMLDAAELKYRDRVDGRSLLDLALDRKDVPAWRDSLMCETYGHGYGTTIIGRMVVKGDYKYVCTENDLDELYNLKDDPYEMKNLAVLSEYDELKNEMREELKKKQEESLDPIPLERLLPKK